MARHAIETKNLTKYYGKTRGIEDVHLRVNQGEIYGFLGPNGAGKTTTIRLLLGLLHPTRGIGSVIGMDICSESVAIRERVGYVPGDVRLYENMVSAKLINFVADSRPKHPPHLLGELTDLLEFDASRKVGELSKGNKQKLALILATMFDPDLLVLDEPTAGLDPLMQQHLYRFLKDFKERGRTVFFSSHNLHEVDEICDRVGIIKDGNLVTVEKLEDIRKKRLRQLRLTFMGPVKREDFLLPGTREVEVEDNVVRLTVEGSLDQVIKTIASYQVDDMRIENASIEDIFFEHYQDKGEEPGRGKAEKGKGKWT